jgi:hypothetical protein
VTGGTHESGFTENCLVVCHNPPPTAAYKFVYQIFQDGVYLELISFTHSPSHYPPSSPERREREDIPWASKLPGWVDFAFLGDSTTSISKIINDRAREDGSEVHYLPEINGGRETPDGKVLKWLISAPDTGLETGSVPFFCGDLTPRAWRVSRLHRVIFDDSMDKIFRFPLIHPQIHIMLPRP